MNPLPFPARVTRTDHRVQATLLNFPELKAEGASDTEVIDALQQQLATAVLAYVDEHNVLPTPEPQPTDADYLTVPLPLGTFSEKASEKLLDFAKAEFDRVLASAKLAEERAKQNGAYALAAIPILSFIRPPEPTVLYSSLQFTALALVIILLGLVGWTLKSQTLTGIGWTPEELEAERETVHGGYRPYADLLYLLQSAWIQGISVMRASRNTRFELVDWQHALLVPLALLIAVLLILPTVGW